MPSDDLTIAEMETLLDLVKERFQEGYGQYEDAREQRDRDRAIMQTRQLETLVGVRFKLTAMIERQR